MRLTVHLKEAKKQDAEVRSKQNPKTTVTKKTLRNTLSFQVSSPDEVAAILADIEDNGKENGTGVVSKYHLSGDTIKGRIKKRKK